MRHSTVIRYTLPLCFLALFAGTAFAQDAEPAPPPDMAAPPPPPPGMVLVPIQRVEPMKQFVIAFNPLAMTIGRYSIQGEYLPALHHAITLNPFYTNVSATATTNGENISLGSFSGFGGELGYRYYSGKKGPNGFYVGPSLLFADYSAPGSGSFTSVGGAIDIGGQGVVGPGIVIGGGFGLQWTKTSQPFNDSSDLNLASAIIAGGGTRPRFLFTVGYAF